MKINPIPLAGSIMMDIQGLELSLEDQELLLHPAIGGIILFARNYVSIEQITQLNRAIRQCRPQHFLIAVDQEGGRVQRFRDGFCKLPPLHNIGMFYDTDPKQAEQIAQALGFIMASELLAVGVDISFAPVLDLYNPISRVIGDRAFHANPMVVAVLASRYIEGMRVAGMAATGKHFPGHGSIAPDSHLEIPMDERRLNDFVDLDLYPFKQLHNQLAAMMTGHIIYPAVDPHMVGFSSTWLNTILRDELKFSGAIISDDLSMEGASVGGDFPARTIRALQAGCDMVLICNNRHELINVLNQVEIHANQAPAKRLQALAGKFSGSWDQLHASEIWKLNNKIVFNFLSAGKDHEFATSY